TRKDALAETRREALDLLFNGSRHVFLGTCGNVTIPPQRLFARGRTAGIESALLREQHKRALRMPTGGDFRLGCGDLLEWIPDMNSAGFAAFRRSESHGTVQCPIHLEHSGTVSVTHQLTPIDRREAAARDLQQLLRGHVEQDRA